MNKNMPFILSIKQNFLLSEQLVLTAVQQNIML